MPVTARGLESRSLLVGLLAIAIVAASMLLAPTRSLARRFLASLRLERVQTVSVDLSSFVGPNANPTLQQMISQMISDKVTVTVNEPEKPALTAAAATELAGFPVRLPRARTETPDLAVGGAHAFSLTVDRARLQAVLDEAGRPDLVLPSSIDGAAVAVRVPRTVRARYGTCPGPPSATADIATPAPSSTQFDSCAVLTEGPAPGINVPAGLDVAQFAQIGLELAGMSQGQARDFLQTVNWQSMLGMSVPRLMRSYEVVAVDGVQGTLLNMAGRRGPTYALLWAKSGLVYTLTGFGSSGDAVVLADSVR
jgi:hypothetical protein